MVSREPTATSPSASPDRDVTMPDAQTTPQKKYYLASDLSQTVSIAQIGKKIMDTPVQLSVRDVLAVSSEVSSYLHEQTRKYHIPIDGTPTSSTLAPLNPTATAIVTEAHVDSVSAGHLKRLYACPSRKAKVTPDHNLEISSC